MLNLATHLLACRAPHTIAHTFQLLSASLRRPQLAPGVLGCKLPVALLGQLVLEMLHVLLGCLELLSGCLQLLGRCRIWRWQSRWRG